MSKRIDAEKLSPAEFPLISFASRGTLLHETPPFERWVSSYLNHQEIVYTQAELEECILSSVAEMNQQAETTDSNPLESSLLERVLDKLMGEKFQAQKESIEDLYRASQKFVIPKFVVDVLQALRDRGFRLCIISNEQKELVEVLRLYHLLDLFESVILADEVGISKPDPEIFKLAASDMDVEISGLLHVGDMYSHDVVAAQKAGASSVLYDPQEYQAKSVLRSMGPSAKKVVEFESLQKNRYWSQSRVIQKFDDLLKFLVAS